MDVEILARCFWAKVFALTFAIGVAMGNIVRGIPLDADHEFAGSLLDLLNPYALTMGVTTVIFLPCMALFIWS